MKVTHENREITNVLKKSRYGFSLTGIFPYQDRTKNSNPGIFYAVLKHTDQIKSVKMFSGFLRTGGVLSDLTIHPIQVLGSKTKKLRIFEIFNRYIFCLKRTKNVLIYFVIQVTHSLSKR